MAEPVYSYFVFSSKSEECIQTPSDAKKDTCKVEVEEATSGAIFKIERQGSKFQVAPTDLAKVTKAFPSYTPPSQELLDYIQLKGEFAKTFGTEENPSEIAKKISVVTVDSGEKSNALFTYIEKLSNFISHGRLAPSHDKMKGFLERTIGVAVYTFADPALGVLVVKILREMQKGTKFSTESRKRIDWLLGLYNVREKFWGELKPAFDKSVGVGNKLKSGSIDIMTFLLANHILAEKGFKDVIFSKNIQEASKIYHQFSIKIDAHYNPSKNLYFFITSVLPKLRTANIPSEYRQDFNQRLDFIISEYEKAAKEEMFNLLSQMPEPDALKDYMEYRYGDTPLRLDALGIILKHTTVQGKGSVPSFNLQMEKMSANLQKWAADQPSPEKQKEAIAAVNHLLKALFEKDGKMEVYWNKQVQTIDNLYTTGNLPLVGANKTALEKLIRWARGEAKVEGVKLEPEEKPHVPLRKITLGIELGIGGAGFGTYAGMGKMDDGNPKYYGRGAALITGGIGVGMAAGNTLSYLFDVNNGNEAYFDIGGGLVGGGVSALIYFLSASKPGGNGGPQRKECPPSDPNCTKFPVDEYGQSIRPGQGFSFSVGGKF